jgi:hypothetical protein
MSYFGHLYFDHEAVINTTLLPRLLSRPSGPEKMTGPGGRGLLIGSSLCKKRKGTDG